MIKNYDDIQLLIEKFTVHNMSAPPKRGIPCLKNNYAHVIHGPTECNQEAL